jgi:hypothetical protein
MIATKQDYLWTQIGKDAGHSPRIFRFAKHEFRDMQKFTKVFKPTDFDSLAHIIARIPVKSPRYVNDVVGQLDVGAALSGEPECFIRRDNRKAKRIRIGINPSNACVRKEVNGYKAAAYAAVVMAARRLGFIVEAEMCYGGMTEDALYGPNARYSYMGIIREPWSLRVELGCDLPVHVLAAYGTNLGITESGDWRDDYTDKPNNTPLKCVMYQSQDPALRAIIRKEYDICFDRLLNTDTVSTMRAFLHRQLDMLKMTPDHIEAIIKVTESIAHTLKTPNF